MFYLKRRRQIGSEVKGRKKAAAFVFLLLLAVAAGLLAIRRRFHKDELPDQSLAHPSAPRVQDHIVVASRVSGATVDSGLSTAQKSRLAFAKLKNGFAGLINSSTYKRTLVNRSASGNDVEAVLMRYRQKDGSDFFRCDTVVFNEATHSINQTAGGVQISNAIGNWDLPNRAGSSDVAFLVTGDPPAGTVGAHQSFQEMATAQPAPNAEYVESRGTYKNSPVTIISVKYPPPAELAAQYIIDEATGIIRASILDFNSFTSEAEFEVNQSVDLQRFQPDPSRIISTASSVDYATDVLYDANKR